MHIGVEVEEDESEESGVEGPERVLGVGAVVRGGVGEKVGVGAAGIGRTGEVKG